MNDAALGRCDNPPGDTAFNCVRPTLLGTYPVYHSKKNCKKICCIPSKIS